jgi:putative hydrolase of the HAD superfamily
LSKNTASNNGSLPPPAEGAGGGFSLRSGWKRPYDYLFFDLDNTLWDFATNSCQAMKHTLEQTGLITRITSFDNFFKEYERINHALWNAYHSNQITKQVLIVQRFSQSLNHFGIFDEDWASINETYLYFMAHETALFPGTFDTLKNLRKSGYQMYIITNGFKEVQINKLKNCGLDQFFSRVFISEEIRTTKPNRRIFEFALTSANASKKKSIMIGDSWETDIKGALEFGIDQVMFRNHELHKVPDAILALLHGKGGSCLELKKGKKTWFIDEITDLTLIL